MNILTAISAALLLAPQAAAQTTPPLACNTRAIAETDRPRYKSLVEKLRLAIRERRELSNGFAFQLDERAMSLAEAVEWIGFERKCCPFLTLRMEVTGDSGFTVGLTGPEGVKAILQTAFVP